MRSKRGGGDIMRYKSGGYEVMIQCVGSVSATCESLSEHY